jgi:GR25 family glycosyltransferase involved in LPS biosynthesis
MGQFSFFDRAVIINLDDRQDRLTSATAACAAVGITPVRFPAIDGRGAPNFGKIRGVEAACFRSHLSVIRSFVESDDKTLLVLEDDVEFAEDAGDIFAEGIEYLPPDWEMLYLGGNYVIPPVPVNNFFARNIRTFTTSYYGLNRTGAEKILSCADNSMQIDVFYWKKMQSEGKTYTFFPPIAWQAGGYSDIQGGIVDYSFMKIKKTIK